MKTRPTGGLATCVILMQIGTRSFAFPLELGWESGFVGHADLRALHRLAFTNPKGQLATRVKASKS